LAERKRRGKDAVDDRLDEAFDDETAADDDIDIDDVADLDEEDLDDEDIDDDEPARRRGNGRATLTKTDRKAGDRPGTKSKSTKPGDKRPTKNKAGDRPGIFGRLINFFREVVAELRKVIWPTRKELLTYTLVVVVFVSLMVTIVFGLDWLFAKGVLTVFGNKPTK
jgi:preprotein translocase subunit SecE